MPYSVGDMLIYQKDGNVLPLFGKSVKGFLNRRGCGLLVDDEEIALRVWRFSDMTHSGEEQTSD
jgi:hypothetical protein